MNSKKMEKFSGLFFKLLPFFSFFCAFTLYAQEPVGRTLEADILLAEKFVKKGTVFSNDEIYMKALDVLQDAQYLYSKHNRWEKAIQCVIQCSVLSDNFETADLKLKYSSLALNLARQNLPKDHLILASAFRQKAEALMMIEKLDSAIYFLTLAIPTFKQHEAWSDFGWSEILVGVNYLNQYNLEDCQLHFDQVKYLLQDHKLPKEDRPELQSTYHELSGVLYKLQGDFESAIKNTKEVLSFNLDKIESSALDSFFISGYFNNLGVLYLEKGDYQRALDNFMQALYSYGQASEDPILLYNIGELLIKKHKHKEAISNFHKSLKLTNGQEGGLKEKIDIFNGLGVAFRELKQYDSAMLYCEAALNVPINYRRSTTLGLLGSIYINRKEALPAIKYLNLAIENLKIDTTSFKNNSFLISRLNHLNGDAYFLNQDTITALSFYQKALVTNHKNFKDSLNFHNNPSLLGINEPIYFLESIRSKAKTLSTYTKQVKQLEMSMATYKLTIQWMDTLQASYYSEAAQLDWSETFKLIYGEAINVAYQCYQLTSDIKFLEEAFFFLEKSKNAILLETIVSNEGKSLAKVQDSLINRERDLNLDLVFYKNKIQEAEAKKEVNQIKLYHKYLSKTRLELIALKEQLEKDYPVFHEWKYGKKMISIATVQSGILDKRTAFLEYFLGEKYAFVFVITKDSSVLIPLVSSEQIFKSVTEFREALVDPTGFQVDSKLAFNNYQQKAFRAYQNIIEAPIGAFPSDIEKIILSTDGILNTIPFEALVNEASTAPDIDFALLPYLIYNFRFHYTYSAALLLKHKARQVQIPANSRCLAFAPSYETIKPIAEQGEIDQLRSSNEQLQGTAQEIKQISHFIDGDFSFGSFATEQKFKTVSDQFGIIHLAMHGTVDIEDPDLSYLKFSNLKPVGDEDNLLHHYEIANMDFQAQLVVLSACETGVGRYEEGEGVFSLARSFMYAGVPSVVMSLWKVSDASTSHLMPSFYKNLKNGLSKDNAMHLAKLRFLNEANVEFRHPFYWSAFVMMGDSQKLKKKDSYLVFVLGFLLLVLIGWGVKRKAA